MSIAALPWETLGVAGVVLFVLLEIAKVIIKAEVTPASTPPPRPSSTGPADASAEPPSSRPSASKRCTTTSTS